MENALLVVARLLLSAVFLVAAVSKLWDRGGTRQGIKDFGIPDFLAGPLAILLPLAEVAVAAALVPATYAWWGAIGALALLGVFLVGIAINLARGRKPDCHCFGQVYSRPIGTSTIVRNVVLAAIAGFVAAQGRTSVGGNVTTWLAGVGTARSLALAAAIILVVVLVIEAQLLLSLMRQNGRLLLRIEALEERMGTETPAGVAAEPTVPPPGLPVGSRAPDFSLPGLYGEVLTLKFLLASGKPLMLVFADPGCGPCNALMPEVAQWQQDGNLGVTVAVISRGDVETNRGKASEHDVRTVLLQQDSEVSQAYQVDATPTAVLIEPDGTIGSPLAGGAEAIRNLVTSSASEPLSIATPALLPPPSTASGNGSGNGSAVPSATGSVASIGQPVPDLKFRDLKGKRLELARIRAKTALLFFDPNCGFCSQMVDDLKRWEVNRPDGAPKLLVISTGSIEENARFGLRSPIVLDTGFSAGTAFGATGTPSAVLIEDGKIASNVAVGAPAVLGLVGAEATQSTATPQAAKIGDPAPPIRLADLDGRMVDLADFRGTDTLVLFWNPGCGFCRQMLDDLKAWEANPPANAPRLLVVSTGPVEENRSFALKSPVLIDPAFSVGAAYGANGTPMAVLVDAEGRIASGVAAGAPAVLALARREQPATA